MTKILLLSLAANSYAGDIFGSTQNQWGCLALIAALFVGYWLVSWIGLWLQEYPVEALGFILPVLWLIFGRITGDMAYTIGNGAGLIMMLAFSHFRDKRKKGSK